MRSEMGDPMARADKLRMQKQVSDLVELTKQQALTIRRLERDSLAKSDRIADMETRAGASLSSSSHRPSFHLSAPMPVPSQRMPDLQRPQPVNPSLANSMKMAELRLVQLQQEVDHWRSLVEEKERMSKENKKCFQPPPPASFSPLQDISLNKEEESLYIRRLLEENRKMKQQLQEQEHNKRRATDRVVEEAEKENNPTPPPHHGGGGSKTRANKENTAPLQARVRQESVAVQCGGEGEALSEDRGGRRGVIDRENYNQSAQSRHHDREGDNHTHHQGQQHFHKHHHDLQVQSQHLQGHNRCLQHQVCRLQEELVRRANQISCSCPPPVLQSSSGSEVPQPQRGMPGPPRKRASCPACRQHLCQPRASQEVRWEARVEPSSVHLCSHVRCLQRQLCHLKLQLQQTGSSKEVRRLEERVKILEEEKRRLQEKVRERGGDKEVVEVIEGIERQRDMYKTHVERLIKDLQSGASRVEVVNEVTRALEEEEERRREAEKRRERRTLASRPAEFQPPPPVPPHREPKGTIDSKKLEELNADSRILKEKLAEEEKKRKEEMVRCEDAEKRRLEAEARREDEMRKREAVERSLSEARGEAMTLRKELREALAELARGREMATQTSPASTVRGSSTSDKVAFLERQLGLTESGLASCQRQLAEQSSAYCDLQSQVVQLRAAAQEGRQEVQELRGRLGRKEDQLGRVVGDRDALRKQLEDATRNLEEERREKEGREERMRIGGQAREEAERRFSEAQVKVAQLQRRVEEENRKVSELRRELEAREDASGGLKVTVAEARGDAEAAREALRREKEEGRGRREEMKDLQAELQRYVAEVRRMEEVVGAKEAARRDLLEQYDELTREVQAFESANRSLEMRSANLVLEVRAREDDLKTAKDRCQDLENHLEEILQQNQVFRLQIQELSAKVDLLTTNLKENRVTRDSVVHDLDSVNELAVRLNTEKIELLSKMEAQNSQVESLQAQLGQVREELLGTMGSLEKERHRAQTLQTLVATSSREERETVIRQLDTEERMREEFLTGRNDWQGGTDGQKK